MCRDVTAGTVKNKKTSFFSLLIKLNMSAIVDTKQSVLTYSRLSNVLRSDIWYCSPFVLKLIKWDLAGLSIWQQ